MYIQHCDEYIERTCIIKGKKLTFDAQSEDRDAYDPKVFYFIGRGRPYKIGASTYPDDAKETNFFIRIDKGGYKGGPFDMSVPGWCGFREGGYVPKGKK